DALGRGDPQQREGIEVIMFSQQDTDLIRAFSGDTVIRARDQLQARILLSLPISARDLYTQPRPLFGEDVASKFPSAAYEIEEAGKCLALERSTASAVHSIRCLEAGIAAISRCLGIPDPTKASDRNWGRLLSAI